MTKSPFSCEDIEAVRSDRDELKNAAKEEQERRERAEQRIHDERAKNKQDEESKTYWGYAKLIAGAIIAMAIKPYIPIPLPF